MLSILYSHLFWIHVLTGRLIGIVAGAISAVIFIILLIVVVAYVLCRRLHKGTLNYNYIGSAYLCVFPRSAKIGVQLGSLKDKTSLEHAMEHIYEKIEDLHKNAEDAVKRGDTTAQDNVRYTQEQQPIVSAIGAPLSEIHAKSKLADSVDGQTSLDCNLMDSQKPLDDTLVGGGDITAGGSGGELELEGEYIDMKPVTDETEGVKISFVCALVNTL